MGSEMCIRDSIEADGAFHSSFVIQDEAILEKLASIRLGGALSPPVSAVRDGGGPGHCEDRAPVASRTDLNDSFVEGDLKLLVHQPDRVASLFLGPVLTGGGGDDLARSIPVAVVEGGLHNGPRARVDHGVDG